MARIRAGRGGRRGGGVSSKLLIFSFGVLSIVYPALGIAALLFQLIQYALDITLFSDKGPIFKEGNNLDDTKLNFLILSVGFLFGVLLKAYI